MPADANFYALEDLLDDDRVVEAGTPGFQTEDLVDKIAWRAIPNAHPRRRPRARGQPDRSSRPALSPTGPPTRVSAVANVEPHRERR
jgi:hypothetical protein